MFFGGNNGILGAPMQQQGVSELQGYERQMQPGQGRVLSSNPMSYGQPGFQLTPGTNPFNPGQPTPAGMTPPVSGEPVNAPLPQGAGGMVVPAGATPPFNPGESGGYRPGVAPAVTGTEVPDTGDVATDIQIAAGQAPAVIPFKSEMSLGQRMSALGMVLSAAGTPDFARVAGGVQAGIMQRTQGIDKYNRDLRAMTTEQTELVVEDGLYKNKHTPPAYKISADGKGIEFIGASAPYFTEVEGGDFRDPADPESHPGGATGQREDLYIKRYKSLPPDLQIKIAEEQGVMGRPLSEFELINGFMKNSAGLAASITGATTAASTAAENVQEKFNSLWNNAEYAAEDLALIDDQIERLSGQDRGGIFQPIEQFFNQVLAEFGNEEAVREATNEQILESEAIQNMMTWFKQQGLGARGLDTPAEFRAWLKATGGNLSITPEATIKFLEKRKRGIVRGVDRYNQALTAPAYGGVDGINDYPEISLDAYRQVRVPPPPPGTVIDK